MKKIKEAILNQAIQIVTGYNLDKVFKLKGRLQRQPNVISKFFLLYRYNRQLNKFGGYIGYNAVLGKKLTLPHGLFGVFISDQCVIGDNCKIFQHVTIGLNDNINSQKFGAPIIGNNVYIGTGAKIIGAISIGDNVIIGANAVVVSDIPAGSKIVQGGQVVKK